MTDYLRQFASAHEELFVYDIGIESLRMMSDLVREGFINTEYLVDDDIYEAMFDESSIINGIRLRDVSYIKRVNGRKVGIVLPQNSDRKTEKMLVEEIGIRAEDVFWEDERMVPDALYRYTKIEELEMLLEKKSIMLSSPNAWDDQCEGYLYHALQTDKGMADVILEYAKELGVEEGEVECKLRYLCNNTRCKCLSGTSDSIVMWNAYSNNNKAVMIEFSAEELLNASDRFRIYPVKYVKNINLEAEISQSIRSEGIVCHSVYITKNRDYNYEDEFRLFYHCKYPEKNEAEHIKIDNPSRIIKSVMVHPKAEKSFVKEVERMCKMAGVKFEGKSKSFEFLTK